MEHITAEIVSKWRVKLETIASNSLLFHFRRNCKLLKVIPSPSPYVAFRFLEITAFDLKHIFVNTFFVRLFFADGSNRMSRSNNSGNIPDWRLNCYRYRLHSIKLLLNERVSERTNEENANRASSSTAAVSLPLVGLTQFINFIINRIHIFTKLFRPVVHELHTIHLHCTHTHGRYVRAKIRPAQRVGVRWRLEME